MSLETWHITNKDSLAVEEEEGGAGEFGNMACHIGNMAHHKQGLTS